MIRIFLQPLPPKAFKPCLLFLRSHGGPTSLSYPLFSLFLSLFVLTIRCSCITPFHCEPFFWIGDSLQRFSKTHFIFFFVCEKNTASSPICLFVYLVFCFFSAIADALPLCHNSSFPFQEKQNSLTWTWQAKLIRLNKSAIIRLMVYIHISFVEHNTDFPYLPFMKAFMFIIRHNKTQKKQWISCFSIWINEEQSNYHDWW